MEKKSWTTSAQCSIKEHWEFWFSGQPWYPQKLHLEVTQTLRLCQLTLKFRLHQKPIDSNEEHTAQIRDPLQTVLFKCHKYKKKINAKHKLSLKDVRTKLNYQRRELWSQSSGWNTNKCHWLIQSKRREINPFFLFFSWSDVARPHLE